MTAAFAVLALASWLAAVAAMVGWHAQSRLTREAVDLVGEAFDDVEVALRSARAALDLLLQDPDVRPEAAVELLGDQLHDDIAAWLAEEAP